MTGFTAFFYREVLQFARSRIGMLLAVLPPAITFGFLVSTMASVAGEVQGMPYVMFVLPGVAVLGMVTGALGLGSQAFNESFSSTLPEYLSLPATRLSYVLAKLVATTALTTAQGVVFLTVAAIVFRWKIAAEAWGQGFFILVLTSAALGSLFLCVALAHKNMGSFLVVSNVAGQVMIWSSTIFYPLEAMPQMIRWIGELNPATHGASLLRDTLTGIVSARSWSWIYLLGTAVAFSVLASWLLVHRARRIV